MVHNEYGVRVTLSVRGSQDTAVTLLDRPVENGTVIQVLTGPVLIYVHGRTACEVAATAWRRASDLSDRLFRGDHRPGQVDVVAEAACQLTLRGTPMWSTTGEGARIARDRAAGIWVQVGPLTIRALDAIAVEDMTAAWTRAALLADLAFDDAQRTRRTRRRTLAAQ